MYVRMQKRVQPNGWAHTDATVLCARFGDACSCPDGKEMRRWDFPTASPLSQVYPSSRDVVALAKNLVAKGRNDVSQPDIPLESHAHQKEILSRANMPHSSHDG